MRLLVPGLAQQSALDAYRAPDGGFAFGLEPDVRGQAGQPVTMATALKLLDEIGQLDESAALPLCDWLASELVRDQGLFLDPAHPDRARLAPGYAPGEFHLAYDYATRPASVGRAWFTDAEVARSLDALGTVVPEHRVGVPAGGDHAGPAYAARVSAG